MAKVNLKLLRGIRINGSSIFPTRADDKNKDKSIQNIIAVEERFAHQLVAASKGVITKDKANLDLPKPKDDLEAELDAGG